MSITSFQFEQMQARLGRPAPKPAPELEKDLHNAIMDHCDMQWPRWKYIHSRTDKPTRNEAGVPDFVIALPGGRTIYVEAKRKGQKLSPGQVIWHREMSKLGHYVYTVFDLDDFKSILRDMGFKK